MKLYGQQKEVYDYIKAHPRCTIREIRDALHIMKPDMRISEINFAHRQETGKDEDVIATVGRNRSREVLKAIAAPLTKVAYDYVPQPDGSVREVPRLIEV